MQTHRFIQIDDLASGQSFVRELMAEDADRIYPPDIQSLLALGLTVRIGDLLHCDLQAFLRINRKLPQAMTRPHRTEAIGPVALHPVSVATEDQILADLTPVIPDHTGRYGRALEALT